jgi:hypothetical protein
MTPEEQMKAIVEATGEKWPERWVYGSDYCGNPILVKNSKQPPSPTDMNALMEHSEKLNVVIELTTGYAGGNRTIVKVYTSKISSYDDSRVCADTPADALREALYQAVKEKDDGNCKFLSENHRRD